MNNCIVGDGNVFAGNVSMGNGPFRTTISNSRSRNELKIAGHNIVNVDGKNFEGKNFKITIESDDEDRTTIYSTTGNVNILCDVKGDVSVNAGRISVGGNVGGNVKLQSGNVTVEENVQGNVRVHAGMVTINGKRKRKPR